MDMVPISRTPFPTPELSVVITLLAVTRCPEAAPWLYLSITVRQVTVIHAYFDKTLK